MKYDIRFVSEIVSGSWTILSLIMVMMCVAYLLHEWLARRDQPPVWTPGMSVSFGMMLFSFGIFVSRLRVFIWRHFHGLSVPVSDHDLMWLVIGGIFGVAGFMVTIHALSVRIFGRWVWIGSAVLLVIFLAVELIQL